jgi:hypothetical protein
MKVRKKAVEDAMENWLALNRALSSMNTEEVIYALEIENQRATPRKTFLRRLTQRYNGIRAEEVRMELS